MCLNSQWLKKLHHPTPTGNPTASLKALDLKKVVSLVYMKPTFPEVHFRISQVISNVSYSHFSFKNMDKD